MTGTPSLDRVLALSGTPLGPPEANLYLEQSALLLSAWAGLETAFVALASDPDDDGDDDSSDEGDTDNDREHLSHALFKKLRGKLGDKAAAKMCAKADAKKENVKATRLAYSSLAALEVALSVTQAERDKAHAAGNSLDDKSYPINNVRQLHSAATLAASHHGNWKAAQSLIRKRAKELGVSLESLPGFGDSDGDEDSEKMAATMVALAARSPGLSHLHPSEAMHHGPYSGSHAHPHVAQVVVTRPHFHNNDSEHGRMLHPGM